MVVARVLGLMAMLMSITHVLPLAVSLWFDDGTFRAFLTSMALNFGVGLVVWLASRRFSGELQARDGFLLVTLAWAGGALFSSVPLMEVDPNLSFTDAYFECISGLTTTGSTVLSNLDGLPPAVNLWRHLLQWFGGMGIIVLAVAILPLLGVGGMQLYKAETPGPMKDTKLTPRITETAKNLWIIYFTLTAVCALCLRMAGMNWFDALCHAFTTLSLGGFSTHDASIGFYDSVGIELVLMVFMTLAAVNFGTHFLAWRGRSPGQYARDPEAKALFVLLVASCIGVAAFLWHAGVYSSFWTALRRASFNVISMATTTGYASVDFGAWPSFATMWMLLLCCLTSSSGSTGGGIKMIRALTLFQQSLREMKFLLHPSSINPMKIGRAVVPNKVIFSVLGFIFVYFVSVAGISFVLMATGMDFVSSFSAVVACINNTGPGLEKIGPAMNYAGLTDFQTWLLSFTMLLGRLELFTVLILFTPYFWRK
jgi:trk system potassium uptake protein TrkH